MTSSATESQPDPQTELDARTRTTGRRIMAALIDIALWFFIGIIAAALFGESHVVYNTVTNEAGQVLNSGPTYTKYLTGVPLQIYWVLSLAYVFVGEALYGQTLGKRLMSIKVVRLDYTKISWRQSVIRNLLRIVDALPYIIPYMIGLATIATTDRHQRVGDKVAHTMVARV